RLMSSSWTSASPTATGSASPVPCVHVCRISASSSLSAHDVMDLLLELPAKERTGWSYLSKNSAASAELLLGVVRITANGGSVLDPDLLRELSPRAGSPLAKLTPRQFDAL